MKATLLFMVGLIFMRQVSAQKVDEIKPASQEGVLSLLAENARTHERILLSVGQTISYKLRLSEVLVRSRIIMISDSSITFQNRKRENLTFLHKELGAIFIPRSVGRKIWGTIPLTCGTLSIIAGFAIFSEAALIFVVPGMIGLANGLIVLSPKKINLKKSWTIKPTSIRNIKT